MKRIFRNARSANGRNNADELHIICGRGRAARPPARLRSFASGGTGGRQRTGGYLVLARAVETDVRIMGRALPKHR